MCPGVFLCIRTVVVKTDKRLFSHGVYMINIGCQNWQIFKDRKDKVSSCGFLKEYWSFQNAWEKYCFSVVENSIWKSIPSCREGIGIFQL